MPVDAAPVLGAYDALGHTALVSLGAAQCAAERVDDRGGCRGGDADQRTPLLDGAQRDDVELQVGKILAGDPGVVGRVHEVARAGLGNSPRAILEEVGRIQSADVVLPLTDDPGREPRLRCIVRPGKPQAMLMLLDRLGLRLPERLRLPSPMREM